MFTKTLGAFKARVAYLADIKGQIGTGSSNRHETDDVNVVGNEAYRTMMGIVTSEGYREYLVPTGTSPLPLTPESAGEQFATVPLPQVVKNLRGVDVFQNNEWRSLTELLWPQRRDIQDRQGWPGACADAPHSYAVISHGSVSGATFTPGTIGLFPVPKHGSYRLWYLPEWTDITNDGHLFLYRDASWYNYHVYCAVIEIAGVRDNDAHKGRAKYAADLLALAFQQIQKDAPQHTRDGPTGWTRSPDYNG